MGLDALNSIDKAVTHAIRTHGPLSLDPVRACSIMIREAGEAMNEALLMTVPGVLESEIPVRRRALYEELAQVAATCAIIMSNLKKEM